MGRARSVRGGAPARVARARRGLRRRARRDDRRRTRPRAFREGLVTGDDLFYIYTSGTTGLPKAARSQPPALLLDAATSRRAALGLRRDDVHYCALPLYHTAGGVMVGSAPRSRRRDARARAGSSARARSGTTCRRVRRHALPVHRRDLPLPPEPAADARTIASTACAR